jgi:hypothetical protein
MSNVETAKLIFSNNYYLQPGLSPDTGMQERSGGIDIIESDTYISIFLNIRHSDANRWRIPSYETERQIADHNGY